MARAGGALGDLGCVANVDDLEARAPGRSEGCEPEFKARGFRRDVADTDAGRGLAVGAARRLDLDRGEVGKVDQQQLPGQLPREIQQNLEREQRLHHAENPRDGSQDARFRAVTDDPIGARGWPYASKAGMAGARAIDLQLALVLVDAGEHRALAREDRGIIHEEFGAEVIAAFDHEVEATNQVPRIGGGQALVERLDLDSRVEGCDRGTGERGLRLADIAQSVNWLAMQIACLQRVSIHDAQAADASAGEILQHRTAESARADDEHAGRGELRLAGGANLFQKLLPGVIGLH